jgi:hypothetical protein
MQVTSDSEGEGMPSCAWVRGRWARLFFGFLNRKHTLGTLSFCHSVAWLEPPIGRWTHVQARLHGWRLQGDLTPIRHEELSWVTYRLLPGLLMLWSWETRSWGCWDFPKCPFCPLTGGKWWGHGTSVLASHDRALAAMGDTSHGWSGCSATGPGDSNKTSPPDFSQFYLL